MLLSNPPPRYIHRTVWYNCCIAVFCGMLRYSRVVRYIWVLQSMFAPEQNMAQRSNAVLHDFVDENNVSSSDDDNCSSIESDVEVDVLRDAACAHGEREDDPADADGGADVDQLHVTQLSEEQLLQRLAEASEAANASDDASDAQLPAKKQKKDLGQHWHTPPAKPQKGRRPWSFGHKLYALVKLKEANGNRYHVRTKILPERKFYLTGSSASLFYQSGKRRRMPSVRSIAAWHQLARLSSTKND